MMDELDYPEGAHLTPYDRDLPYEFQIDDEQGEEAGVELMQGEPPRVSVASIGDRVMYWSQPGALGLRRDIPATIVGFTARRVRILEDGRLKPILVDSKNLRTITGSKLWLPPANIPTAPLDLTADEGHHQGRQDMAWTYWQHEKSGEIFAVRTDLAGMAEGVTGPISADEATVENHGNFDYDTEDAAWANREPMRLYDPTGR